MKRISGQTYQGKVIWELKAFSFDGDREDEIRNIMKSFLISSEVRGHVLLILISFTTSNRMFSYTRGSINAYQMGQ